MLIRSRETNLRGGRTCAEYVEKDHKEIGLTVKSSGLWEMGRVLNFGKVVGQMAKC